MYVGVVQYEAFILQNETTKIDTDYLLQEVSMTVKIINIYHNTLQINNALSGSKLAINASFFFIEQLNMKTNE